MAAKKVNALAQQLAGSVQISRKKFTQIYDAVIRDNGIKSPKFAAAVLDENNESPANDAVSFVRAFKRAIEGDWYPKLVLRAIEQGALTKDALEFLKPTSESGKKKGNAVKLQAIMDLAQGFDDPNAHASGMIRTIPKICLVQVRKGAMRSSGTGFLIGPQSVLTAWHVVEPLLDNTGKVSKGSDKFLQVLFDYFDATGNGADKPATFGVVEDWLGDFSTCAAAERPGAKGISSNALQPADVDPEHLDFAVIKLNGSPGRERGTVELRDDFMELPRDSGVRLTLLQHPNSFPQRFAMGNISGFFGSGDPAPRVRHMLNTQAGSSGGLCADSEFKSVAMHQATVLDAAGKPIANQAVPSGYIRKRLISAFKYDPQLDPIWKLNDAGETPVIGREKFQRLVWSATRGEKRVIIVRGDSGTGVGFSTDILRALRPPADADIFKLTADMIGTDAVAFATQLLKVAGRELGPGESLPAPPVAATAPDAWLKDQLMREVIKRIQAGSGGKTVWVVIDNYHNFNPPEGRAREFLTALMGATLDASFMRFLLLGYRGFVPGVDPLLVDDETPGTPSLTDLEMYIRRLCIEKNKPMSNEETSRQARLARQEIDNATGDPPPNPWKVAGDYMTQKFRPVLLGGN